jgi:xylulokinase
MGVAEDHLPRIVECASVIGGLGNDAASATGLRTGIPVLAGMGDQSAGFLGASIIKPNDMADVAGTYQIIALCTDAFRPDLERQAVEVVASALPNRWYLLSLIVGGGLTTQWFLETFAQADLEGKLRHGEASAFDVLEELAASVSAGSDRLLFIPHLGGQACPPRSSCRGMWMGFTWTHRREHFYRAALEAVAYDQYLAFESMRAAYPEIAPRDILVYGGGSNSRLWNQIKADVMGVSYVRSSRDEVATLGCALLAAYSTGVIDDLGSAAGALSIREERYEPSASLHEAYLGYVHLYADLLEGVNRYYTELARLPAEA